MNILVLPNAFKGSLSAPQAARILHKELSPRHRVFSAPVSDGGDGFIDFFKYLYPSSRLVHFHARNAFYKNQKTSYLLLPGGKTAVIETARICGLGTAKKEELNPLNATSYGVGQAIMHAVKKGVKNIYIGLGGVACNDGGSGAATACGTRFSDKQSRPLALGAQPLLQLAHIDNTGLVKNLKGVRLFAVADVTNPLLGPKSSAKVFGPQKGANPSQVKLLDRAMAVYARRIKKELGKDIAHTPSTAAAGAICAGLYGLFNAKILLGADFLLHKAHFNKQAQRADLIITAEGKLDSQTFGGKAPLAVIKLAKKYKKPVLFICGQLGKDALKHRSFLPDQIAVLSDFARSPQDCRLHAAKYLKRLCKTL
ncbi:glycerate kinase [Candidatus Avelusimicrobium aviculae]|uniref:glycerate kinase n=1 Tax=Candidatus Avelusimicrobium aviculae TaxID=3416206 RepID=UPI003D0AA200